MAAKEIRRAKLRERMFGDRAFYAEMISVVVPIIIQNTVSNVVSLLDNVMVGRVGTLQFSAVWPALAFLPPNTPARTITKVFATASA